MKKQKYEIPWWDEWYEADLVKRLKKVKELPVLNEWAKGFVKGKDKEEIRILRNSFYTTMNSLFEDLAEYMQVKMNEKRKV